MRVKSICSIIQHVNASVVEDQIYYFNEENIDNVIRRAILIKMKQDFKNYLKEMMDNLDEDVQRGTVQQKIVTD